MKNKYLGIIMFLSLYSVTLTAQNSQINIGMHYGYLQHSKLDGIYVNTGALIGKSNHQFEINFEVGFAEGNRNIDIKNSSGNIYNFEYKDYFPPYQTFPARSFLFDYAINLNPKTSTTIQTAVKLGYSYQKMIKKDRLQIGGGIYGTYVNKTYLVAVIYDIAFEFYGDPWIGDWAIPYHVRYLDIGPYVSVSYQTFQQWKTPLGFRLAWNHGFDQNGWFTAGVEVGFRL